MNQGTRMITEEMRERILTDVVAQARRLEPADAVSSALVVAAINVRSISLEDWKAIIFDAFQAVRREQDAEYLAATT
jgi:hypothetical protein